MDGMNDRAKMFMYTCTGKGKVPVFLRGSFEVVQTWLRLIHHVVTFPRACHKHTRKTLTFVHFAQRNPKVFQRCCHQLFSLSLLWLLLCQSTWQWTAAPWFGPIVVLRKSAQRTRCQHFVPPSKLVLMAWNSMCTCLLMTMWCGCSPKSWGLLMGFCFTTYLLFFVYRSHDRRRLWLHMLNHFNKQIIF